MFYFKVAVDADDKKFVGQPCCDQLLNNIWYDKLEPAQLSLSKRFLFLLSVLSFGLAAPFFIQYRVEKEPSKYDEIPQKQTYEMTVNETQSEEASLLPKRKER